MKVQTNHSIIDQISRFQKPDNGKLVETETLIASGWLHVN